MTIKIAKLASLGLGLGACLGLGGCAARDEGAAQESVTTRTSAIVTMDPRCADPRTDLADDRAGLYRFSDRDERVLRNGRWGHTTTMPNRAAMLLAAFITSVVGLGFFWVGRLTARVHGAPADACPGDPPLAPAPGRASDQPLRAPGPVLAACPPPAGEDPLTAAEARRKRAEFLLSGVFDQLAVWSRRGTHNAEARADVVLPYLDGVLNGALQADPAMRGAFSAEFTSSLCERTLDDDQAISLAHIARALPDVGTESGFECFFSKAKEGVPLWKMLDAWRRSGLPKTPAIARLQASATDSRTTRRFLSDEEARAQRIAGLVPTEPQE